METEIKRNNDTEFQLVQTLITMLDGDDVDFEPLTGSEWDDPQAWVELLSDEDFKRVYSHLKHLGYL